MRKVKVVICLFVFFIPFISKAFIVSNNLFSDLQIDIIPNQSHIGTELPISPKFFTLNQSLIPEYQEFIEQFQEDNSKFFNKAIEPQLQLPYDHLTVLDPSGNDYRIGKYNNPTAIGLWLVYLTNIAKGDIVVDNISPNEALEKLNTALETIEKMPKWHGLLGWNDISGGKVKKTGEASAEDNGNFAASAGVVIGAFIDDIDKDPLKKEIVTRAQKILKGQKKGWNELWNKSEGLLYGDEYRRGRRIVRMYVEGRLAALMAIIVGDVDREVWDNLVDYNTEITPNPTRGEYTLQDGRRIKFMKPWEGAFQGWLPLIFIPESKWSPGGLGKAHQNYGAVQVDYANETGVPALRSAASSPYSPTYDYIPNLGVPEASESYVRGDIGAPYATALFYLVSQDKAIALFENLDKMTNGDIKGPLGWRDSVGEDKSVSNTYVTIDHLMMTVAMAGEKNQEYFVKFLEQAQSLLGVKRNKLEQIKTLYEEKVYPFERAEIPEVKAIGSSEEGAYGIPQWAQDIVGVNDFEEKIMTFDELKQIPKPVIVKVTVDSQELFLVIDKIELNEVGDEVVSYWRYNDQTKEAIYEAMTSDIFIQIWNGEVYLPKP